MTKVLTCTCVSQSEFQDRQYGKNKRLFNQCGKEANKYRCTVCGKEITKQ